MKIYAYIILQFIFFASSALAQTTLSEQVIYYEDRYNVSCTDEKITDNKGDGYDLLYGTRNMRVILHGVAYRGGANNFYHKTNKRDNHNPLPIDGLTNLCNEGFSNAIYLYSKNFSSATKSIDCGDNTLSYLQISGNSRKEMKEIIDMVYKVINREISGPIYLHCWNGWHQSGYVSSAILKQFCGYSDQEALAYWMRNTDGANKGLEAVKKKVVEFKPFEEYQISKEIREEICPCQSKK